MERLLLSPQPISKIFQNPTSISTMKPVQSQPRHSQVAHQTPRYQRKFSAKSTSTFCHFSVSLMVSLQTAIRGCVTLLTLRRAQGLQFLDKTSLGYSSVFGIITDNHLVGQDYSWCSYVHPITIEGEVEL